MTSLTANSPVPATHSTTTQSKLSATCNKLTRDNETSTQNEEHQSQHHRSRRKIKPKECYGKKLYRHIEQSIAQGNYSVSADSSSGGEAVTAASAVNLSANKQQQENIKRTKDKEFLAHKIHKPYDCADSEPNKHQKNSSFSQNSQDNNNNNNSNDNNCYFNNYNSNNVDSDDDHENINLANLLPSRDQFQFETKFDYLLNIYKYLLNVAFLFLIITHGAHSFVINVAEQRQLQPARSLNLTKNLFKRTTSNNNNNINDNNNNNNNNGSRSAKIQLEVDALAYLQRYGYMNGSMQAGNANNLISEDSFHEAVMSFQRFAGIPETGSIDSMTVKYMQMPRCGNKDQSGKGENGKKKKRRRKRYALQGSKWRRQELTYRISQYPARFLNKKHEVDGQIEKAFKIWSQVAPIDFVVKKEGRVHIDIRFTSGEHGDGDPFDGPGNTLAHAYFPQYGGDAHFDDQEYWTVDSYAGTNIFQVAAHELGHSLGLGHSSVREALMAPFYQKYKPNFKLHADDILGIAALYGERDEDSSHRPGPSTTSTTTTSTTTTTTENPGRRTNGVDDDDENNNGGGGFFGFGGGGQKPTDLCQDSAMDAITRTEDGNTYVFRGQYYWQIKNEGLASGYPAKISRDWEGLPGNLDAALTWSDGKTFFFKGDKYWRFFNKRREPGYPKLISSGFAGIPNNVDAALVWSGNGKTYFFKKDKYWRFDSKQEPPVSSQYPKSIKNWSGLPTSGIDAAFKWDNGMTYFFKDDVYYRFDDRQFEVDTSARPSFPRSTAEWWYGCTNSNLPIKKRPESSTNDELDEDQSSSSSVYHRKPNLILDENRVKPAGNSITRSILSSLSALFPSSSSTSTASSSSSNENSASLFDDWSYHRGIGEESRPLKVGSRSAFSEHSARRPTILDSRGRANILPDITRWTFPLSGSSSGSREQSLSELRMAPSDSSSSGGESLDSAKAAR